MHSVQEENKRNELIYPDMNVLSHVWPYLQVQIEVIFSKAEHF